MDRRTLFFVAAMSIALFSINSFFSYLDQDRAKEWHQQQQLQKIAEKKELLAQLDESVAPLKDFPIVKLYSDETKKNFLTFALEIEGNYLSTVPFEDLPAKAFSDKGVVEKASSENISLFREEGAAKLPIRSLPPVGGLDLQLLFLNRGQTEGAQVTLGEYVNTFMTMPVSKLENMFPEEYKGRAPKGKALALSKVDGIWTFSGLYITKGSSFVPTHDLIGLQEFSENIGLGSSSISSGDEEYFVLENAYQQLVFTTKGGAIAEVNLPFRTDENTKSVVLEIGFDRDMVSLNPQNAYFPNRAYSTIVEGKKVKKERGTLGGYYPLLRRDLIEKPPYETIDIPAQFYAMNVISEDYAEVGALEYRVKDFTERSVTFEAAQPYRRIRKTFTMPEDSEDVPYVLDCTVEVEGDARGLWLTTGVPEVEWINGGIAPALKYRQTKGENSSSVEALSLPSPELTSSTAIDWICNSNGFFGMILDPLTKTESGYAAIKASGEVVPSRLVEIDQQFDRFKAVDMPGYAMQIPLPPRGGKVKFRIYAGPFATDTLKAVDAYFSDAKTGYNPDYISSQTTHGWFTFISAPFSKFLFIVMRMFYALTASWGFSIILLTLALRVMMYPLTAWSMRSSKKMQEVGPKMKAIEARYKNDSKKMNLEKAALYKEEKINPISGCLPMLIQLPFFIGMFDLLKSTFELRGAVFVPGWIDNLAAPDVVFTWDYPLFFIGTEFHLLPILAAAAMFVQMKIMQPKKDPATMTDQERTQQSMGTIMTLPFVFIFYNAPSGLCIYWICSTIFGVLQQKFATGFSKEKPQEATVVVTKASKKKGKK